MLKQILRDEYRVLTFRTPSALIRERPGAYLAFGLFVTWVAGIGRYWDDPTAALWQHLGLGSVVYVFLLALVIWAAVLPLGARNWSYRNVLLLLTLTAPPALLYAIPVEQFFKWSTAHAINTAFLAIVALWRVALLFAFLNRVAGLSGFTIVLAGLLPLALVVDCIALMGLEQEVYQNMVGLRDPDGQGAGAGRDVAQAISVLALALTPALLAGYAWIARNAKTRGVPFRAA